MNITIQEGKHAFTIQANKDNILKEAASLKSGFEPDMYVAYGDSQEHDDPCLTKEQFEQNANDFYAKVNDCLNEEVLSNIIKNWPRKKNGTFNRRNMQELAECNNCIYICEWHNTWIYQVLKVNALDDNTLQVHLYKKNRYTWINARRTTHANITRYLATSLC